MIKYTHLMMIKRPAYIKIVALCLLSIWAATTVRAQQSTDQVQKVNRRAIQKITTSETGIHEFQIWGGYSFYSPYTVWGKTPDSQLGIIGMRYNRKLFRVYNHILEYASDFNFFARYVYPEFTLERKRTTISGIGISPVGFQFNITGQKPFQPFLKSSVGFLYLSKPFPDERGKQLNFTLEIGAGLEFILSHHSSVTLGYKYHHMSNGASGYINPGIDSNMVYAGITIF